MLGAILRPNPMPPCTDLDHVIFLPLYQCIFVVKTILASRPICREIEKQKAKKEVEKWLAQGKMSEAKKLARKYGVFRK